MRRVARSLAAPDDLLEKGGAELERARAHYRATPPPKKSFAFKAYKLKSVKRALEEMFHGKCAYCETFYASTQPLDVEHFRPKGAVAEAEGHPGYWWLAMAWDNLLPSCIDCNRKRNQITPGGDTSQVRLLETSAGYTSAVTAGSGKKDSFPLAETGRRAMAPGDGLAEEKALLLNPCTDDPAAHLRYFFDPQRPVSFVLARALPGDSDYTGADGLSLRGATSIHVYGLNRLRLVQARTELLRHLEFLAGLAVDLKLMAENLQARPAPDLQRAGRQIGGYGDMILAELVRMAQQDQPYSAMVTAWLTDFRNRLASA